MKKLTLWILLLMPVFIYAQNDGKGPVIIIDLDKKNKNNEENADSTKTNNKKNKDDRIFMRQDEKLQPTEQEKPAQKEDPVNYQNGIFKAIFIAGLNLSQIDGDEQSGYTHPGFNGGVGVMVKFHRNMSVSTAIIYNMKGATKKLDANDPAQQSFNVQWDYVQVPLMFNVHDKKLFIASAGLGFGYLIRNKITHRGIVTDPNTGLQLPLGEIPDNVSVLKNIEPKKFDLSAIVGFQFLIKQAFGIGAQFEYSLIGLRPSAGLNTKVQKMYNNTICIKFNYILSPVKKKK